MESQRTTLVAQEKFTVIYTIDIGQIERTCPPQGQTLIDRKQPAPWYQIPPGVGSQTFLLSRDLDSSKLMENLRQGVVVDDVMASIR